jgi:DNA-binding MarR family transcriptional regulator
MGTHRFDDVGEPLARRLAAGLSKIGMALRAKAWEGSEASGLTPTQGQILAFLRAREPAGARLTAIAEALAVTPQTTSNAVAALIEKALLSREADATDGRAVRLRLTRAGRRAATRAAQWPDFLLGAIDALTPGEQEIFLRGLVKMIRSLQERGEIPVSRLCVSCRFFRPYAHADAAAPHHCAFVDAPFGDRHLRLDCADHAPAEAALAAANWSAFLAGAPQPSD